jgi:hypothetical protein
MLFGCTGCVAQSTYDSQVAEAAKLQQNLATTQVETAELAKQVAEVQTSNKQLDAMAQDLRAAIQREEDTAAVFRQRSQDRIAALQTQVASLVNQGRTLGRDIADAKQQNASLRASVAQAKRELQEQRESAAQPASMPGLSSGPHTAMAPNPVQAPTPEPPAPPQQFTQAVPPTPAPPVVATPPPAEPPPADKSWTGWFMTWLSGLWNWIFE